MKKNKSILNLDNARLEKKHKEDLGLSVPASYFENSKEELLKLALSKDKQPKSKLLTMNFIWIAAASVIIVLSVGFLSKYYFNSQMSIPKIVSDTLNPVKQELLTLKSTNIENEILVSSLFIADEEIDSYLDEVFIDGAIEIE